MSGEKMFQEGREESLDRPCTGNSENGFHLAKKAILHI